MGELTFPLYLLHFPIMVFLKASGLWPDHNALADAVVVVVCMGAAHMALTPSEALKRWMRSTWRRQVVASQPRSNTAR